MIRNELRTVGDLWDQAAAAVASLGDQLVALKGRLWATELTSIGNTMLGGLVVLVGVWVLVSALLGGGGTGHDG
jgi:hypothetical protein